nr:MAG TPA: hypothetical protein [Caudoviricetes sp.]
MYTCSGMTTDKGSGSSDNLERQKFIQKGR